MLLFLLSGCIQKKYSAEKKETAEIIQLSYVPSNTQKVSGVSPVLNAKGGLGFAVVDAVSTSPEKWVVVLKCSDHHQTFALENKELYSMVKPGDKVVLKYVEEIAFDLDGKGKAGSEKVVDYHTTEIEIKSEKGPIIIKRPLKELFNF